MWAIPEIDSSCGVPEGVPNEIVSIESSSPTIGRGEVGGKLSGCWDCSDEPSKEASGVSVAGVFFPFNLPLLAIPQKRNLSGYPPQVKPLVRHRLQEGRPRSQRRDLTLQVAQAGPRMQLSV